jgi:hypothetical protein
MVFHLYQGFIFRNHKSKTQASILWEGRDDEVCREEKRGEDCSYFL